VRIAAGAAGAATPACTRAVAVDELVVPTCGAEKEGGGGEEKEECAHRELPSLSSHPWQSAVPAPRPTVRSHPAPGEVVIGCTGSESSLFREGRQGRRPASRQAPRANAYRIAETIYAQSAG